MFHTIPPTHFNVPSKLKFGGDTRSTQSSTVNPPASPSTNGRQSPVSRIRAEELKLLEKFGHEDTFENHHARAVKYNELLPDEEKIDAKKLESIVRGRANIKWPHWFGDRNLGQIFR